ncbi:MAG: CehA/McbA family metallohydrolase [Candidatus Hydrogenedentes bacterium]|nr:CehA/McbA family metallohydrolase [Candidatus Hydrogenedentota bacterium]
MNTQRNRLCRWVPKAIAFALLAVAVAPASAHDGESSVLPALQPKAPLLHLAAESGTPLSTMTLRLVESKSGALMPGVVRFLDADGAVIPVRELLPRSTGVDTKSFGERAYSHFDSWYVVAGEAVVSLPMSQVTVEAFSGLRSAMSRQRIDLNARAEGSVTLSLESIDAIPAPDWYAGNAHLHLQRMTEREALHYAAAVARGDGLDLVYFSYLERAGADEHYISNRFSEVTLGTLSQTSSVFFGYGEEYRHNFPKAQGYGHAMFLNLRDLVLPASLGPDITGQGNDDRPLYPGLELARERGATILWCHHTRGHEDIPNWLAGRVDAQLIFDQGSEGAYEVGAYRYLNVGRRVPLATGTDWFLRDMAMTYVRVEGERSGPGWLQGLREGRSFITNGPLLEFTVNGAGVGETLELSEATGLRLRGRAVGRCDFGSVEVVENGRAIATAPATRDGAYFSAAIDHPVTGDQAAWYALRLPWPAGSYDQPDGSDVHFNEYGKPLFAHTSPIYVRWKGDDVFIPEAAEALIAGLHAAEAAITEKGTFSGEAARDNVIQVYRDAATHLAAQIASHTR